ncbi:unnamed protein product [marine sediment metagenome]|uniref:Uncharacterized protein n=1 Tax=marine sediment metagenome TaxID=412755 RepID=X0TSH8_9ZZZZ
MLTRRGFLKGLLSSVAAGALIKNGIVQPEQVLAEARPWTIDMGANTWRNSQPMTLDIKWYEATGPAYDDLGGFLVPAEWGKDWIDTLPPFHVNCRCTLPMPLLVPQELLDDAGKGWDYLHVRLVGYEQVDNAPAH